MFAALTLFALLASSAHAFWRLPCTKPVVDAIIDPIVSPGRQSGHGHTIMGGSNIGLSSTFEDMVASDCTTCKVKDDKSAYWTPQLYYEFANGTFASVSHGGMLVYYLQRGGSNETIKAFPDGLRMLAGNPYLRNNTNTVESSAISWNCIDYNVNHPETPGFDVTTCPDGLRAQVFFPSCWDGVNLDSADHKSHMAYPSEMNNGFCPSSHPVHLISIFYELYYSVDPFNKLNDGGRFVLANGDPTGYGLHGDFLNGWNKDVLQRAVDTCTADSGVLEDCGVFQNEGRIQPDDTANQCSAKDPVGIAVDGSMPHLPGCVAVSNGPSQASPSALVASCVAGSVTGGASAAPASSAAAASTAVLASSIAALSSTAAPAVTSSPAESSPAPVVTSSADKASSSAALVVSSAVVSPAPSPAESTPVSAPPHTAVLAVSSAAVEQTSAAPAVPSAAPAAPSAAPAAPSAAPAAPSAAPAAPSAAPAAPSAAPAAPSAAPAAPSVAPAAPSAAPSAAPAAPSAAPAAPSAAPAAPSAAPAAPSAAPAAPSAAPAKSASSSGAGNPVASGLPSSSPGASSGLSDSGTCKKGPHHKSKAHKHHRITYDHHHNGHSF